MCSIEEFVASKDSFRVAPFGFIPTPYPFQSLICSRKALDADKAVESQYMNILQKYSIKDTSILLRAMWPKCSSPLEAIDTFIVETSDIDNSKWQEAASEILLVFYAAGLLPGEINIEISNPAKMIRNRSRILPDDQQLLSAIVEIEPRVYEIVRNELPGIWTSIAYHMRGSSDDESEMKPTVMIICKPGARHHFEKTEASIMAVIHSEKYQQFSLQVELIPGSIIQ
jgi:hypothetical protein